MPKISAEQLQQINMIMSNDVEFSTPAELSKTLRDDVGLSKEQVSKVLSYTNRFLTEPLFELSAEDIL